MSMLQTPNNRPLAVITDASHGIGFELARQFAEKDYNLLITANDVGVYDAQNELERTGANVTSLLVNLATYDGVEQLFRAIRKEDSPLTALVLTTNLTDREPFRFSPVKDEINLINLQITSTVHITKLALTTFERIGSGTIFYIGPYPTHPVSAGSRTFLASFAKKLREENQHLNITFLTCLPDEKLDLSRSAEKAFQLYLDSQESVPSVAVKIQNWVRRVLPEKLRADLH